MSSDPLPALIRRYLERALPVEGAPTRQVCIEQTGEMINRAGGRAMRFTATERLAVDRVAFSWDARFPIVRPISLRVRDAYSDGRGQLTVRVLGLPVQRQSGHDASVAEAYRYLAELPWAPQAIATNPDLHWRVIDERTAEVLTSVEGELPVVRFEFGDAGDVVRCSADARPRVMNRRAVPTPWGGDFSEYRTLGDIRMPTRAEVYWDGPDGRFVYWRGEVSSARALGEPFEGPGS